MQTIIPMPGGRPAVGSDRPFVPRPPADAPPCNRARHFLIAVACCWLAVTTPLALLDPGVIARLSALA